MTSVTSVVFVLHADRALVPQLYMMKVDIYRKLISLCTDQILLCNYVTILLYLMCKKLLCYFRWLQCLYNELIICINFSAM